MYSRHEIGKGIWLSFVGIDKFKCNSISVKFIVPLDKNTASANSLVFHVAADATEKYPSMKDVNVAVENMYDLNVGVSTDKKGDAQIMSVRYGYISDRFALDGESITDEVLGFIEEHLMHPKTENGVFMDEYVNLQRTKNINAIKSRINDKGRYAQIRLVEEMCENDPFAICEIGDIEILEKLTSADVWAAYKNILSRARIEIIAGGDMDESKLVSFFTKLFSGVDRKDIYSTENLIVREARPEVKKVIERQNVTQGKLVLGFRSGIVTGDADSHIMSVFLKVYGASTVSKLFMNVREKLSLCYYCSARDIRDKGIMTVSSGIMFENEQKAFDEIMRQLKLIQDGEITEFELDTAKKELIEGLNTVYDELGSILSFVFQSIMNNNSESIETKIEKIKAVTIEDVVRISQGIKLDTYYFLCGKEDVK